MAYAVLQDMIDRHGEDAVERLADRDGDGTSDSAAVTAALEDATQEINSYLSVRYTLPLASTPEMVELCCVDIGMYRLAGSPDVLTEEITNRYKSAIKWLQSVAAGKANIGLEDPVSSDTRITTISAGTRLFTRTTMKSF